jgi:hypothetical protein
MLSSGRRVSDDDDDDSFFVNIRTQYEPASLCTQIDLLPIRREFKHLVQFLLTHSYYL